MHTKGGLDRWRDCYALAQRVMPDEDWRHALAASLREAIGCTFVTVHTARPRPELTSWPRPYDAVMDELRVRFLPRIEAVGEGPEYALRTFGRVYAPLEVARSRPLADEMRKYLVDADVRGYCVAFLGSGAGVGLDGLVVIGDDAPSTVVLERAGPALLGLAMIAERRHVVLDAAQLTTREREIARLLAEGLTNLNVARRLDISEQTVAVHARRIYKKLGVHNRADLAQRVGPIGDAAS